MEPALGAKLIGLVVSLVLAVLTAAGQACLFHLNRARLRALTEHGPRRGQAVLRLAEQPGASFSVLVGLYALSCIGLAAFMVLSAAELATDSPLAAAALVASTILGLLVLQAVGRAIAIAHPEGTAVRLYVPLRTLILLLTPLLVPLHALERRMLRALGVSRPHDPHSAEEELRLLVEASDEGNGLAEDEREMIHGIFEMSQVTAREVMVPRIDMVAVPHDAVVEQVLDRIIQTGHSRLPIYEGSIDNIIGVVYAKDILKHLKVGKLSDPVRPLARPAYFVPEAKKVDELLQELQQRRVHMAIVVDEYGGTAGLITIEDLLEEIVGEIRDEYDLAEEARIERISDREAILDARVSIREVNELLSLDLPDDEFDTLGGLVYDRLGKVPAVDDEVRVDGCLIRVLSTEGRRIKKVRLLVGEATVES